MAASPDGRRVAVVAMGTQPDGLAERAHIVSLVAFVSNDGGATWNRTAPVPSPPEGVDTIDASVVVDAGGAVHVAGLMEGVEEPAVFHVVSQDGGARWSAPSVLNSGRGGVPDREWVSLSPEALFISWQEYGSGSQVAVSTDGGRSWRRLPGLPVCVKISPVVWHPPAQAFVSCEAGPTGDGQTLIVALDLAEGKATQVAQIDDGCAWSWLLSLRGALVLVCDDGRMRASRDDGRSWSDASRPYEPPSEWSRSRVQWAAVDDRRLHFLVAARELPPLAVEPFLPVTQERVAHATVDPSSLQVEHSWVLTAEDAASQKAPDGGLGVTKDDFHGIAPVPDGVILAWTRDRGIDVAHAVRELLPD